MRMFTFHYSKERILGLDILRAIAILTVLYIHGHPFLSKYISQKWYYVPFLIDGVDLFFVLSGFLIGGIIFRLLEKGRFNRPADIWQFWKRRWFRTLPNYYLVLSLLIFFTVIIYPPSTWNFNLRFLFFLQNFTSAHHEFFGESWSLAVEEWFYLLIPIIFFGIFTLNKKNKKISFLIVIFIFLLAPVVLRLVYSAHIQMDNLENNLRQIVVCRLDSLMYGVLGAFFRFYYYHRWIRYKNTLFAAAIILIIMVRVHQFLIPPTLEWHTTFKFLFNSIVSLMCLPFLSEYNPPQRKPWHKFFIHISVISYSLYILNLTVVAAHLLPAAMRILGLSSQTGFGFDAMRYVMYLFLNVSLAYLLYIFWEKPMMDLRDKNLNLQWFKGLYPKFLHEMRSFQVWITNIYKTGPEEFWRQIYRSKPVSDFSLFLIGGLIVAYLLVVLIFAINIPEKDDFHSFLFLDLWLNTLHSKQYWQAFQLIISSGNIFNYTAVALIFSIMGVINFAWLTLIANLGLMSLVFLFTRWVPLRKQSWLFFLPVVFILLIPYHGLTTQAFRAFQGYWTLSFSFFALYFLSLGGRRNSWIAMLLALPVCFTSIPGFLVLPAGMIILYSKRKELKPEIVVWVFMLIVSLLYRFFINKGQWYPEFENGNLPDLIQKFLTLFGSVFEFWYHPLHVSGWIAGILILAFFVFLMIRKWQYLQTKPLIISLVVLVLGSAFLHILMSTGFRHIYHPDYSIRFLPFVFLALIYCLSIDVYQDVIVKKGWLLISLFLIFFITLYQGNLYLLGQKKASAERRWLSYEKNPDRFLLSAELPPETTKMLNSALIKKYFQPRQILNIAVDQNVKDSVFEAKDCSNIRFFIDEYSESETMLVMTGWAFFTDSDTRSMSIKVSLISGNQSFIFSTHSIKRPDVTSFFRHESGRNLDLSGFRFELDKRGLPSASQPYKVGLVLKKNGLPPAYKFVGKTLDARDYGSL